MKTCAHCGKLFRPWRAKAFCSERCRKRTQNQRLGYSGLGGTESVSATLVADSPKRDLLATNKINDLPQPDRRYEPRVDRAAWTVVNEVTDRFAPPGSDALAWTMLIEGHGWFGRIGKEFSFGPTSRKRARTSVEAKLRGEPFAKCAGEHSSRGDCSKLLGLNL